MPLFGPPNIAQLEAKRDTQGLIKALAYKDPGVRIAAADALAPLRDPLAVEPLVALLSDDNPGVRRAAVGALSARGGFRVVEPLVAALADIDPEVQVAASAAVYRRLMTDTDQDARRATAVALGKLRDPNAIDPLIKAVSDADEGVGLAAIRALQAIGDIRAVLPLVTVQGREQLRKRTTGRSSLALERAAAGALDTLMGPAVVPNLIAGIKSEEQDVREIVVKRLGRIGGPDVAAPLAGALKDDDATIRRAAARGLADISWQPTDPELGAIYYANLREWRKCAECGAPAIPSLIEAFDAADAGGRAEIVAGLVGLGWEPDTNSLLAGSVWAARGEWDRVIAMGPEAVGPLTAASREAAHWRDRLAAARALETLGQPSDPPFLRADFAAEALAILDEPADSESAEADKKTAIASFVAGRGLFKPEDGETIELCECGYPLSRVDTGGERTALSGLLGYEVRDGNNVFFCPACDTARA